MSLLDAISFYRRHNVPVQNGNDSAETIVVMDGRNQIAGLWSQSLSGT